LGGFPIYVGCNNVRCRIARVTDVAQRTAPAEKLVKAAHNIFGTAEVAVAAKGFADEKVLAPYAAS
jgi:hypothetical protein